MIKNVITQWLNYLIALVWIANGLFCKVLNLVPRHEEIVSKILATEHPRIWTLIIGFAETGMAAWIITGFFTRLNAITQIMMIAAMNILEFILVPDLLLWGRFNALFAGIFILVIFWNEFHLKNKLVRKA